MKKIIVLGFALVLVLSGCSANLNLLKGDGAKELTKEQAKERATNFITTVLTQPGTKLNISDPVEEYGMYKIKVGLPSGQTVDSYISKDGKAFFPQSLIVDDEIKKAEAAKAGNSQGDQAAAAKPAPKNDKPVVELFVMSHCPYGLQMEKGMVPVAELLGSKINFDIKFVSYSMHGKKELDEETRQNCIKKLNRGQYLKYVRCYWSAGDDKTCVKQTGIKDADLNKCIKEDDAKYKVTEQFDKKENWVGNFPPVDFDKAANEKYGVAGSPTLVINGQEVQSGRDQQSLLDAVCAAFKTKPAECSKSLSKDSPVAGFGDGTTPATAGGAAPAAGCGQ